MLLYVSIVVCLTNALPKILTEVETFGERCQGGGEERGRQGGEANHPEAEALKGARGNLFENGSPLLWGQLESGKTKG